MLVKGGDALEFNAITDATLLATAKRICANLGKPEAKFISLTEVTDADRIFAGTTLNGDGVIVPESAVDDPMRQVIRDIATCTGTVPDRSGKLGVDLPRSEAFFAACEAFDAWIQKAEAGAANILPLGSATLRGGGRRAGDPVQGERLLRALPAGGVRPARPGAFESSRGGVPHRGGSET